MLDANIIATREIVRDMPMKANSNGDNSSMKETMGRRIESLLWQQAMHDDLPTAYEQMDLVKWLSGEEVAPNGNRYKLPNISQSTVNRIINDNTKRLPIETIVAIAEIFGRSLDWLVTGEEYDYHNNRDVFITPEANRIGALIDSMDSQSRTAVLTLCRDITHHQDRADKMHREVVTLRRELLDKMVEYINYIPPEQQAAIRDLISKIEKSSDGADRL